MERRLERLSIKEISKALKERRLVFLPVAPLEWHSYHLPYGTDPLDAEAHALALAERLDGLVHPTLYMGTGLPRRMEEKVWFELEPKDGEIVGMDFPGFPVKSMYWSADVLDLAVREAVRQLKNVGFRTLVIINGHGDDNQRSILKKIAADMSDDKMKILYFIPFWDENGEKRWIGHADLYETSVAMYNHPDLVHLDRIPVKDKLAYRDYGIMEGEAFSGNVSEDRCCIEADDPRTASLEKGKAIVERNVEMISKVIENELQ